MVYRCLDPGRDWDAYCDDHPDQPKPEDVDECYHRWECPSCSTLWGIEDIEDASSDTAVDIEGKVYCMECLVDGKAPECELTVAHEAFEASCADARAEAIAEYGMAHVRRCERRR